MGWLPLLAFCACVSLTLWLWQRQAYRGGIVGEAEAYATNIDSAVGGRLVMPVGAQRPWQVWDQVGEGQIIAQLDDSQLLAQMATIQQQVKELEQRLIASKSQFELDSTNLKQRYNRDRLERIWQHEQYQLQAANLIAQIAVDKKELLRLDALLKFPSDAYKLSQRSVARQDLVDLQKQRDVVEQRIYMNQKVLERRKELLSNARVRRADYKEVELALPEISEMIVDIEEARKVQLARLEEIKEQLKQLTITSPIRGTITMIHHRPGEDVQAGDPILTVASDTSTHIVSYWREGLETRPSLGLPVGIRLAQRGAVEYTSTIEEIGPQIEPVPPHQLRDPANQEYGLPVKIPIPETLQLRPGELIHILYRRIEEPGLSKN